MPKKAATVSEPKETKKKTTKKAPAKKPAAKKAAAPKKTAPKSKRSSPAPEPAAVEATPAPVEAPAARPAPEPQVRATAPNPGGPQQRPLYIPREIEAFLRAAGIPNPTEKSQLDGILAAMSAARAAASQPHRAAPVITQQPAQQAPQQAPQQHSNPDQQHQPQQQGGHQQQQQHFSRRKQRDFDRRGRRDQHRNRQTDQPPNGDQSFDQSGDQQQRHPRDPAPDEPVEIVEAEGYCEIAGKGFGFVRDPIRLFLPNPLDVFVTPEIVKRFGLRDGHWLKVEARKSSRGMQIQKLLLVNDQPPEAVKTWPSFEDLTTINPIERFILETVPERTTTRVIDLLIPIGKGQRGLIVAPPRTGKTTLLNHMAQAIVANHPDVKLMILLVDERPEEVTDFKRNIPEAELWASSNDMEIKSHTRIAQLAIERARRLVESGHDVFILLDSITRMGRAFNNAIAGGGRTMSGGVDSRALEIPRKIFAAARNTEEAGSLTIVATALIDTGSRMDELIFQEFKGTGNSEIVLDRKISDQRIYPAIDIFQSGTRREELIVPADALQKINVIRRGLAGHKPQEAIERVLSFLKRFPTNEQLLREIPG